MAVTRWSSSKKRFIEDHRRLWPIRVQCRALRVSISGFHQRVFSRSEIAHRRYLSEEALVAQIRAVYEEHLGTYGWPRIWRQLRKSGTRVG